MYYYGGGCFIIIIIIAAIYGQIVSSQSPIAQFKKKKKRFTKSKASVPLAFHSIFTEVRICWHLIFRFLPSRRIPVRPRNSVTQRHKVHVSHSCRDPETRAEPQHFGGHELLLPLVQPPFPWAEGPPQGSGRSAASRALLVLQASAHRRSDQAPLACPAGGARFSSDHTRLECVKAASVLAGLLGITMSSAFRYKCKEAAPPPQ